MNADTFTISRNNLGNLMKDAIQLYIEYVECYLQGHDVAVACAVSEVIESLDAELELYQDGSLKKEELTQIIESNAKLMSSTRAQDEERMGANNENPASLPNQT